MALFNVSTTADLAGLSATVGDMAFVADNDRTSGNPFQLVTDATLARMTVPFMFFILIKWTSLIKIDFNGPRFQQLTLNSNVTITGSLNILVGVDLMIRFMGDVTSRTLTFPAQWKIYSISSSYTVPANGVAFLNCFLSALRTTRS